MIKEPSFFFFIEMIKDPPKIMMQKGALSLWSGDLAIEPTISFDTISFDRNDKRPAKTFFFLIQMIKDPPIFFLIEMIKDPPKRLRAYFVFKSQIIFYLSNWL